MLRVVSEHTDYPTDLMGDQDGPEIQTNLLTLVNVLQSAGLDDDELVTLIKCWVANGTVKLTGTFRDDPIL